MRFHAIFGVINSILQTPAVSDWMHDVFFNSRCVKVTFAYSCNLKVDINYSQRHSPCDELNFVHSYSLRLDSFLLP